MAWQGIEAPKQTIEFPAAPSFVSSKKWIKLIPKNIGNRKRDCAWGCAREDQHHLRKSSDRKAQIRNAFVPLTVLICAFRSENFLRWCLFPEHNRAHSSFFYFQEFLVLIALWLSTDQSSHNHGILAIFPLTLKRSKLTEIPIPLRQEVTNSESRLDGRFWSLHPAMWPTIRIWCSLSFRRPNSMVTITLTCDKRSLYRTGFYRNVWCCFANARLSWTLKDARRVKCWVFVLWCLRFRFAKRIIWLWRVSFSA